MSDSQEHKASTSALSQGMFDVLLNIHLKTCLRHPNDICTTLHQVYTLGYQPTWKHSYKMSKERIKWNILFFKLNNSLYKSIH